MRLWHDFSLVAMIDISLQLSIMSWLFVDLGRKLAGSVDLFLRPPDTQSIL